MEENLGLVVVVVVVVDITLENISNIMFKSSITRVESRGHTCVPPMVRSRTH